MAEDNVDEEAAIRYARRMQMRLLRQRPANFVDEPHHQEQGYCRCIRCDDERDAYCTARKKGKLT